MLETASTKESSCVDSAGYGLLVGSAEFCAAIESAILSARRRALVQVMTFELDAAGARLWDTLKRSPAREKVLCVDAFSMVKLNDSMAYGLRYWADRDFRDEVRRTRSLLRAGHRDGVKVAVTNPVGALWQKYPLRNHKKLMVVDDRAFLGGINFSEHNFAWHDLMLQTANPPLVEALAQDIRLSVAGVNQTSEQTVGDARLYLLDGHNSREAYEGLFNEITAARRSVTVISPYLSNPLLSRLRGLSSRLRVRIISPARNNKPIMRRALTQAATGADMEVLLYQPQMSHLKAVVIDDEKLMLGSCNFDFVGYELQQEVVISTTNSALVREFRERVLEPTLAQCQPAAQGKAGRFRWSSWGMTAAELYIRALRRLSYR